MARSTRPARRTKLYFVLISALVVPVAAVVLLEGLSSLAIFGRDVMVALRPVFAEELSTQYDPEIGWVARKSFSAPHLYGPGIGLTTNSRGFRGGAEVSDTVPPGKRRLVCSGDSFTLGLAVADQEAWCARLANEGIEAVNMGQGGYGIDQAYLWYKRAAHELDHDVHLFSFVTHDFHRMAMTRFIGYGKPRLAVDGDSLRMENVPVPARDGSRAMRRLGGALRSLRTVQIAGSLSRGNASKDRDRLSAPDSMQTRDVFARIVADLKRINERKESTLLLVYLPSHTDIDTEMSAAWRTHVRHIADSIGVALIDLIPQIRSRPGKRRLYFTGDHELRFAGATGHFNADGNRWVAETIREHLDQLALLTPPAPPTPRPTSLSLGVRALRR
jgi:hypothetical protein